MNRGFSITDIIDFDEIDEADNLRAVHAAGEKTEALAVRQSEEEQTEAREAMAESQRAEEREEKKANSRAREPEADSPMRKKRTLFKIVKENGQEFLGNSVPACIGRGESADINLDSISISRKHAVITKESGKYYLEDFSTAGTFIAAMRDNRPEIKKLGKDLPRKVEIKDGQIIQFGVDVFIFKVAPEIR